MGVFTYFLIGVVLAFMALSTTSREEEFGCSSFFFVLVAWPLLFPAILGKFFDKKR